MTEKAIKYYIMKWIRDFYSAQQLKNFCYDLNKLQDVAIVEHNNDFLLVTF